MKGSVSQRSPGSWFLRFDLGTGADGRRKQKTVTVRGTKKDAERELRRLLHELETGVAVDPGRLTLGQYLERWLLDYAKANVGAKTYERYEEIVWKHLIPALGRIPLAKLQPLAIQAYYTEALRSGRRNGNGGLSAQTVLHHHRILSAALRQAVKWQLVGRSVADAVEPPRPERKEMECLDAAGAAALLDAAAGDRLHLPVLLALTTGMRLGEILGLRWEDVDLKNGSLRVQQAIEQTREGIAFKQPKTHTSRRPIALPSLLVDALVEQRRRQVELRRMLGSAWKEHGLICPRETGEPWPPKLVSKTFEHLAARAGVPQVRFHDLRHSHATQLLLDRVPLKVVSERLGHARSSTTMDIYSHVLPGMQEEAARRVDERLGAALKARDAGSEKGS